MRQARYIRWRRWWGQASCVVGLLLSTGCAEDCSTDVTYAVAKGTIRDTSGIELGTAFVSVRAEAQPPTRHAAVSVAGRLDGLGAPLRGHVRAARVLTADGVLLYDIAVNSDLLLANRDGVVYFQYPLAGPEAVQRLRAELLGGRVRIEVDTDLPGAARVVVPLLPVHDSVPHRHTCVRGPLGET